MINQGGNGEGGKVYPCMCNDGNRVTVRTLEPKGQEVSYLDSLPSFSLS